MNFPRIFHCSQKVLQRFGIATTEGHSTDLSGYKSTCLVLRFLTLLTLYCSRTDPLLGFSGWRLTLHVALCRRLPIWITNRIWLKIIIIMTVIINKGYREFTITPICLDMRILSTTPTPCLPTILTWWALSCQDYKGCPYQQFSQNVFLFKDILAHI